MGQETRQKTAAKKGESGRTSSRRLACRSITNEYETLREDLRKLWTSWAATANTSEIWRRIEQSGLENALQRLAKTKPELAIISNVSSEDAVNIGGVMTEFCETLNCIRLAYVENTKDIFDNDEREKKYLTSTCPTIVEIWRAYCSFAAEFAANFVESSWVNSSEHRELLSSVVEIAANSVKLVLVVVNLSDFSNTENADNLISTATTEAAAVCKVFEELFTCTESLGNNHSAMGGLMELVGWTLYGLTHVTNKVVKVGIEARSSDQSLDDQDDLNNNITSILKTTQEKWSVEVKPETPPPQPQTQDKKGAKGKQNKKVKQPPPQPSKEVKIDTQETGDKRTKESYIAALQNLDQVYQKYSDNAWESKRLPVLYGTSGSQILYRMDCYNELDQFKVDTCSVGKRKEVLDSLALTDGHILHSDIFMINPGPLECSKEVILKFPLLTTTPANGSEIYLKVRDSSEWKEVEQPEKVEEDGQTFIVFKTTKCEAFTALSFSASDALVVGPSGATYVSDENSKVEVIVPQGCFQNEVTIGIKVTPFKRKDNKQFIGTLSGTYAVEVTSESGATEMEKPIMVQLPMENDNEEKDTELVVVRYNDSGIQVLDKKQMAVRMVDNGLFCVDFKGFWCIAVLRIKRIFLNMRDSIKREFLIGYGKKVPCNILTFIDDISRGDEKQTFVMEVVARKEAESVVDARRLQGLVEIKKGRSKDILLKRGDQVQIVIDGQMRATDVLKEEDCTLCYLNGTENVISISTEIKRDPEKLPDAMVIYKQLPDDTNLHSLAIMTRDLSELPTDEIVARPGSTLSMNNSRSKSKDEGTNILKMESLMSLARELTFDEATNLGQQLGVKEDKLKQIKEQTEKDPVAGNFQILCNWRGRFARATMADFLISSLKAVGKLRYADLVQEVRKHNRCLEREDFEMSKKKEKIIA